MTFSIVALDGKTKALGAAVASGSSLPLLGKRVAHVRKNVGAIATQGLTEVSYGIKGLELLGRGYEPEKALEALLRRDPEREQRQVIMIDAQGRTAAFTGKENFDFKGHIVGANYVAAGNLLANENVLKGMADAFEKGKELPERLLLALEAAKKAGGDARGERSAAMVVVSKTGRNLTLTVNDQSDPIKELGRIFEKKLLQIRR